MTFVLVPGPPCGVLVYSSTTGLLLGFCERETDHVGGHTPLVSDYRVWWSGRGRDLRLPEFWSR